MTEDEYRDLEWDLKHEGDGYDGPEVEPEEAGECEGCGSVVYYDEEGDLQAACRMPAGGAPEDGTMLICLECLMETE